MKLFCKKKNEYSTEYNILGIKIKFTNYKEKINNLKNRLQMCESLVWSLTSGCKFIYTNENKFSLNDYKIIRSKEFYDNLGYFPDFKNPQTFNEKINWLQFNYYNKDENICCDKSTAKEYISNKIGKEYVIPLIGVWNNVNEINFDKLPNQVVFKNTISGGGVGVKIIKDLSSQNMDNLKYELNNLLFKWNFVGSVPQRRLIIERLIAEKYLPIREGAAVEYKMFCFNGKMEFCLFEIDYFGSNPRRAYYNREFNECNFSINPNIKKISINKKPKEYEKMIELAEILAQDFPFVRVDFYVIYNRIYVSELTFNSGGGYSIFCPREYDYKFGKLLDLTQIDKKYLTNDIVKTIANIEKTKQE